MRQLWSGSRSANWCQKKEESDHVTGSSLIYMGPIRKAIHVTKFMSLTSSAVGLALQPTLISQATTVHPVVAVAIGSFVGFFTYVTPFLIHWMTKRYVVEMYFDAQNQTFECYTLTFFLRHKRLQFQASDVVIPDIPGPFTSIMVRDTPLLIDPKHFTDVEAYKLLMGYDKPLDLKLSNRDNESG